jgi:hypothetical protein
MDKWALWGQMKRHLFPFIFRLRTGFAHALGVADNSIGIMSLHVLNSFFRFGSSMSDAMRGVLYREVQGRKGGASLGTFG